MTDIENRYDFLILFDVKDGNPNGDPDAGNQPRVDPETGEGLVTDVCLKRKIRNWFLLTQEGRKGYDCFVKEKAVLNLKIEKGYEDAGVDLTKDPKGKALKKKRNGQGDEVNKARNQMCKDYIDVRAFGAVMSTGLNAGQVRGPCQVTFARSVDPVITLEHSITRMAVATEKEAEAQGGDNRTMGRKNTVPYGLYKGHGFINPMFAAQTGFSNDDLTLVFDAVEQMFEHDRSAARGLMAMQKLIIFKHSSKLGNAPAHKLFERVHVERKNPNEPARTFADYEFSIDQTSLEGIEVIVRG